MKEMMFRRHVSKFLSAYCHGELSAAEMMFVKEHMETCARCQQEYEEIQLGAKFAAQLRTVTAPASLWTEINKTGARSQSNPTTLLWWRYVLPLTAILLLAFGSWLWLKGKRFESQQVAGHREAAQPSATPLASESPVAIATVRVSPTSRQGEAARPPGMAPQVPDPAWEVDNLTGAPRIGTKKITDKGRLGVGEWLETDNASRAKIKVAEIGYVDIDPNSRVQLVQTKNTEHRIALAKGKMSAMILAPPRLFIVDTPSATAVDLGCAYTLEIDEHGASLLHVTSGWVSFVRDGQESFIPAGAMCATRKGLGVGTPYFAEASAAFKSALTILDFGEGNISSSTLDTLLAEAHIEDTLTLWHLLGRQFRGQTAEVRGRIFDRLAEMAPPPDAVTRAGIVKGDRKMLDLWWGEKMR